MLDGPRVSPASGGAAKQLVVLLHGYGANGDDLIGLAEQWKSALPEAAFVAPNAPQAMPLSPFGGYQWFELTFRDPEEFWRGVTKAGPVLDAFLDSELARYELDESRLALVGFSQGTMMALHVGVRRAAPAACIVGYSGHLAGPEHLSDEIRVKPPVLLVHGDQDEVIPVGALHAAREALAKAGVRVEWHISAGIGHGIDATGLDLGGKFLSDHLLK